MRLGEILIASGLLSEEQLREALDRQASSRGRLGTQLVQLGFLSADQVALGLGKQHQVPPVLVRHFTHHDPAVLPCISASVAAEHFILPIAYSRKGGGRSLVVCFRDPRNTELIARLQEQLQLPVLASVASELAIRVYLERFYQVDAVPTVGRPASTDDDVDIDFSDVAESNSALDTFNLVDDLVELDHHQVAKAAPARFVPEAKRSSGIKDALKAAAAAHARTTASAPEPEPKPEPEPEPIPLEELLTSIQRADKRSEVSDSIMAFLEQRFAAGLIFTVKDGLAMGYRGFGGHLDDEDTVAALMLPLSSSIFGLAHDTRELWRGDPKTRSSAAQERFLTLFAMQQPPGEVVVAPVAIGLKVLCLIYAHSENGAALSAHQVGELAAVASATNQAFERIIRNARKPS